DWLGEHGQGTAFGLEGDVGNVAEVFAGRLQRQRPEATDAYPIEVMERDDGLRPPATRHHVAREPGNVARPDLRRRDDVETALERRLRCDVDGHGAEVGVWVGIRDHDERRAVGTLDLEYGVQPTSVLPDELHERRDERGVARATGSRSLRFDPPNELRVEEDAGVEEEAAVIDATERHAPRAALLERIDELCRRRDGIAWNAEPAREHARSSPRNASDWRRVGAEAVRDLVEAAVA